MKYHQQSQIHDAHPGLSATSSYSCTSPQMSLLRQQSYYREVTSREQWSPIKCKFYIHSCSQQHHRTYILIEWPLIATPTLPHENHSFHPRVLIDGITVHIMVIVYPMHMSMVRVALAVAAKIHKHNPPKSLNEYGNSFSTPTILKERQWMFDIHLLQSPN